MPIYEYECSACGVRFERKQSISDDPVRVCPQCEGSVRRVIHPVGIVFKASGFYVTDNRKGPKEESDTKTTVPVSTPSSTSTTTSTAASTTSSSTGTSTGTSTAKKD